MRHINTLSGFEAGATVTPLASLDSGKAECVFPLAPTQESIWVMEQLVPGSSAYNMVEAWRLTGRLDVPALQQSLDLLVRRHESLRTRFREDGGKPAQEIMSPHPFAFQVVDLSKRLDGNLELERLLSIESKRTFNLQTGPLGRAVLYRLAEEEHVFMLGIHHLVSDEWSFGVFLKESAEAYNSILAGKPPSFPEMPIQYADFAVWQRELAAEALKPDLDYWREQLRLPLAPVSLPADIPHRNSSHDLNGDTELFTWPRELQLQLKQLSSQSGTTLFMTLLAAFKTLLHRYTRQTEIIVGSPIANRGQMETEGLIGLLVNTHALRTDLSGDPTFIELLTRVRDVVLGAYSHQSVSVDQIIKALSPARQAGAHPFFNIVFGLQTAKTEHWPLGGLKSSRIELDNGGSKFDWTLLLTETAQGLKLRSEYSTRLFRRDTISRVVGHFHTLLRSVVAAPQKKISQLPLLTPVERAELISKKVCAVETGVVSECLTDLFEAQVSRTPESTAVSMCGQRLSYSEINAEANRLAHWLRHQGVRPGQPVALCLERSPLMVIAILGVIKSGAAYLPIEPSSPVERVRFMMEDARPPVVLTQHNLRPLFPAEIAPCVLCLDSDVETILSEPSANPTRVNTPADNAYIIYTSGSTGRPKGVLVSHLNVVRLFRQTESWFGFNRDDVWTLFHSYTFDFSVWELWGALLYGGRLVIVPYLVSRSPAEFYELVAAEKVTVLNQTPSAFRQFIWAEANACTRRPLHVRYVICGGEALELESLRPWFDRHDDKHPQVINMYGITETTVHVTFRIIRQEDVDARLGSVIGVPIPDLDLHLLDQNLEPVPPGVPGEICVSGAGVAQGYLNRPELSATRFVPDPFCPSSGARMYRSGDLARRTSSGELEYLGRMDDQVKIRGFRIELGEIESVLNSHPGLRESTVIPSEGLGGDKRLVAYVVPKAACPGVGDLRRHVSERLPDYMVPSAFVMMKSLPLTVNGKVDRKALPAAEILPVEDESAVLPRNEMESLVARTWCELLGRKSLGIHESFFQAGGHSLLATQATSRLAAALDVELSVRSLFEAPTVAELAQVLAQAKARQGGRPALKTSPSTNTARNLLSRLDKLSDSEVDELLKDLEKKPVLK